MSAKQYKISKQFDLNTELKYSEHSSENFLSFNRRKIVLDRVTPETDWPYTWNAHICKMYTTTHDH